MSINESSPLKSSASETAPNLHIEVWCTLSFESVHCWPDAPEAVMFLRVPHRHMFHAKLWFRVMHDDRDIEFILAKRKAQEFVEQWRTRPETLTWSCERWAIELLNSQGAIRVEVSEDLENGAIVSLPQKG